MSTGSFLALWPHAHLIHWVSMKFCLPCLTCTTSHNPLHQNIKIIFLLSSAISHWQQYYKVLPGDGLCTLKLACMCVCVRYKSYGLGYSLIDQDSVKMMDIREHHHWFLSTLKKPLFHHVAEQMEAARLSFINAFCHLTCFSIMSVALFFPFIFLSSFPL